MLEDVNLNNTEYAKAYISWPAIAVSFILWALIYQASRLLLPTKSREYCCRILSFSHGVITAFIGINQCLLVDNPFKHPEWRTTDSQRFLMVCSLGYFVHDLGWLFLYDTSSKLMVAHHVYSVLALYRLMAKDISGAQCTCALGCMELSNPLLQIRWFLRSEGFYPSVLYTSVEVTFLLVFFVVRLLVGTYLLFVIVFEPKNEWDLRMLSAAIYIMSWMFMINICKYFITKYGLGWTGQDIRDKGT